MHIKINVAIYSNKVFSCIVTPQVANLLGPVHLDQDIEVVLVCLTTNIKASKFTQIKYEVFPFEIIVKHVFYTEQLISFGISHALFSYVNTFLRVTLWYLDTTFWLVLYQFVPLKFHALFVK